MSSSFNVNDAEIWTPLKVVQWAAPFLSSKGLLTPRLDAEMLVAHALGLDRLKIYLQFDRPLSAEELSLIRSYLIRRSKREPIQYITGAREFFGLNFKVSPSALIPRPETEHLVEKALEFLRELPEKDRNFLDLGTGSGCIAISIALTLPCRGWGVELSEKALELAKENAENLQAPSLTWRLGKWFDALEKEDPGQFPVILSNPPYISDLEKGELDPEVLYEPSQALFGGVSGLQAYQELAPGLWNRLSPGGRAYLELHADRLDRTLELFDPYPWERREVVRDLQGHSRLLILEKSIKS
jgi:release factor glutamine methyltransferase